MTITPRGDYLIGMLVAAASMIVVAVAGRIGGVW